MRILMLDLDTLRPDHLGCYGYRRNTSPNIDRIAAGGVRFDNYYCSDAPCLPSRATLVSGRFGIHTGIINHSGSRAEPFPVGKDRGFRSDFSKQSLWMLFRNQGMHTASISTFAERHSAWWFNAGFHEMHNVGTTGLESAEKVTPKVLDWIERNAAQDNWFLHVNYWDAHTPYRAPAEFGNPFAEEPLPSWHTAEVLERNRQLCGGHSACEVNMFNNLEKRKADGSMRHPRQPGEIRDMADYRRLVDGYDCGIRYLDGHIGTLLEAFRKQGVLDDLAIIVTSDHGENMGELNVYAEHGTADEPTHRIPMIVTWPGARVGHVDRGLHYSLDLAPTLSELFGKAPQPLWDGRSYAASLLTGADTGRDHLILGQCCHGAMRSVRFREAGQDWIYIRVYHDFYHLYPAEMLFNLTNDPHEELNLAADEPEICARAARRLLDWQEEMLRPGPDRQAVDPLQLVLQEGGPAHSRGQLPAYCQRLRATGRGALADELRRRHPQEFLTIYGNETE